MDAKTSGPKGAYGNLSAAPGVGATLSEDASGALRHRRDPLNALSSALAGLKVSSERARADERRAELASGLHKARGGADSAFSAAAVGGGASVSQTFFRTVDAWNKMADDERELMHGHAEWLAKFRGEIELAAARAWSGTGGPGGKENFVGGGASSSSHRRSKGHQRSRAGGGSGKKVRVALDQSKDLVIHIERH